MSLRYSKPDVYFSIVEKLNQSKLERNANVDLMMNSLIGTDLGDKNIKAMYISKDIISIKPDTDPIVWSLLEKILEPPDKNKS